jgi:hypothetical protein
MNNLKRNSDKAFPELPVEDTISSESEGDEADWGFGGSTMPVPPGRMLVDNPHERNEAEQNNPQKADFLKVRLGIPHKYLLGVSVVSRHTTRPHFSLGDIPDYQRLFPLHPATVYARGTKMTTNRTHDFDEEAEKALFYTHERPFWAMDRKKKETSASNSKLANKLIDSADPVLVKMKHRALDPDANGMYCSLFVLHQENVIGTLMNKTSKRTQKQKYPMGRGLNDNGFMEMTNFVAYHCNGVPVRAFPEGRSLHGSAKWLEMVYIPMENLIALGAQAVAETGVSDTFQERWEEQAGTMDVTVVKNSIETKRECDIEDWNVWTGLGARQVQK